MGSVEFAIAVRVLPPYVLEVTFDDGERRRVDMEPLLDKAVFVPLRDPAFFARVEIDPVLGTVVWPNGADVSPEFLYYGKEGPPAGYYDSPEAADELAEEPLPVLSDAQ